MNYSPCHADSTTASDDYPNAATSKSKSTESDATGTMSLWTHVDSLTGQQPADEARLALILTVILTILVLLVCIITLITVVLLWYYKRRTHKLTTDSNLEEQDTSYSTLDRETKQQIQQQSLSTHTDLYGKIQLSPSTGQSEPISKSDCEDTNTFTSTSLDCHYMQESDSAAKTNPKSLETGNDNSEFLTYAVVNKKMKKKNIKDKKLAQG